MIVDTKPAVKLVEDATQELLDWASTLEHSDATYFEKAQALATRLGAHYRADGLTEIGFWTPRLLAQVMRKMEIYLEVLTPLDPIDLQAVEQTVTFRRERLFLKQEGEFFWGVVAGMRPGSREQLGSFYWLRYIDQQGNLQAIRDVVSYSLPYGVFGPAELYDMSSLQNQRADLDYFKATGVASESQALPRVPAPRNILQLHIGTASKEGTVEGLTCIYREIASKLAANLPLTPAEENYTGYDAIQLLPIEPTIEFRDEYSPESEFFAFISEDENGLKIKLRKSNTQDWGYDVPILGSSATNSALLGSLRPDELVDFIATLHNFPTGPIHLIYDLVYGHADNQSELLLNRQFLKGPNMYGQDLNHQLPTVRAIFLEMQRRKLNTGADGIRIDGGQDFRFFNPLSGLVEYDDAYLLAMSDVVQEIGGHKRLLFTIFEDGRPWPAEGWEDISTYRELIDLKPESYQWGPLIFAHNTPALETFWDRKWRRVCEVMYEGDRWITGCANHDTVRRGNQIELDTPINWHLGSTLPEVFKNAYDNPATTLWVYGFSPGLPMDFINATMHAPWMFFRNTDERYGVKVVAEEIGFLDWQITSQLYAAEGNFTHLKSLGFLELEQLREFGRALQTAMIEKDYNLVEVVRACQFCLGDNTDQCDIEHLKKLNQPGMIAFLKDLTLERLKSFSLMFMEDCYEVCNVSHYETALDSLRTGFNLNLRRFRHAHPWLGHNLAGTDRFNKISDNEQTVFYGIRSNPQDHGEQVAMVAHMGGKPITVTLGDWLQLELAEWKIAIASPGLDDNHLADLRCFELQDSQAVLLKHVAEKR
ncbi:MULTISPECIES: glucosylglycerol hydrolase [unclassified Coleofasciculus]|uniref:glucosylglycerol hydrolase n=1 Tax=unclassified Coleofasciculus TaxID=2692782 RepID=UPI00187E277A|nr:MULTISPECIES: glucosylglycerol hydrolase [unclassified Coleofasciculus]MBE9127352.1 alpha-amylase [Coleofasciculus sp. LEGE 07081]MBE9150664.1 alpha-amylase [Coleofasciculus sp. LEGE 07092]